MVYLELKSLKRFSVDPTIAPHDLVIPNWNPFTALNWLANRAKSGAYLGANYKFFENSDGYNFASLEGLYEKASNPIYSVDTYTQLPRDAVLTPEDRGASFKDILEISFDDILDVSDNISSGMYASKIIEHDIVKREFQIKEFNYNNTFFLYNHLNSGNTGLDHSRADLSLGGSYTNKSDSRINYVPKHYKKHNNFHSYGDNIEDTFQIRNSQFSQLDNFRVTFVVAGDSTKTVGDVVKLRIVSPEPMQSSPRTIWDPIYSGNYLVVGLKHMIDPEKFTTTMTAVKDTYENPITNSTLRLEV